MKNVDLIINCYERNYKKIISKKFISKVLEQNKFAFANIFIIVNNVVNRKNVGKLLEDLKKKKIISNYFFVEDYLEEALEKVGLTYSDLDPIRHYSDWAYVALYVSVSEYLVHWDPDIYLTKKYDWITESRLELEKNKNFIAAAPLSKTEQKSIKRESYKGNKNFLYNNDFSDQIFLIKTKEFLVPIYKFKHIYSLRIPLAEIGSIFEKRVDAYMKKRSKTRIINLNVGYMHPEKGRTSYPYRNLFQVFKHYVFMIIVVLYFNTFFPIRNLLYRRNYIFHF